MPALPGAYSESDLSQDRAQTHVPGLCGLPAVLGGLSFSKGPGNAAFRGWRALPAVDQALCLCTYFPNSPLFSQALKVTSHLPDPAPLLLSSNLMRYKWDRQKLWT